MALFIMGTYVSLIDRLIKTDFTQISMMETAKKELDKRGYNVVGAYLSPTADFKLQNKLGKNEPIIPARDRVEMIKLATCGNSTEKRNNAWIMPDSWSSNNKASGAESKAHVTQVVEKCMYSRC